MTPKEAINAIKNGNLVVCSVSEYPDIRRALHEFAGSSLETDQDIYAQIALSEIKRLDHDLNH
jgi:hypothetical protein